MKSCRTNGKVYIGVFLFIIVITSGVTVEGRPQQQQHRPYNAFNRTFDPFNPPQYQYNHQYQPYNQQYQRYQPQYQYHQNTRAPRNISATEDNNYHPVVDPTFDHQGTINSHHHIHPVIDPTVPIQPPAFVNSRYQPQQYVPQQPQYPVSFNNNNNHKEFNGHKLSDHSETFPHDVGFKDHSVNSSTPKVDIGNRRQENLHRDVRNSTVTNLPASGPWPVPRPIVKEKTRILSHPVNPSRGSLAEDLRGSTQDIIFPDSFENLFDPISKVDAMPQCAGGSLFCEDVSTYPYQQIRDTLRRTKVNSDLFFDDEIVLPKEIANRISGIGGSEEKFMCKSVEQTIYPKAGMTKNNKWKYIINQNQDGYIQGVRVENCLFADKPCDLSESMPLGIVTSCKQKFVTRRMMSYDGELLTDLFLMPSACCCSYHIENPLLRARSADTTPVAVSD